MIDCDGRRARTRFRRLQPALFAALLLIALSMGTASALAWKTGTVDSEGQVGYFTSLALDGAGNPRISYFDQTNGDLKYAWHDGASWHVETADHAGTVGRWTSLALDGAGNPRISYADDTAFRDGNLKYAWRDGSGWHAETVDSTGWVGEFTSLALDAAGNPRISYYDRTNEDLRYAWRDGSGWRIETVDSLRIVGWYSSLALDAGGNPRIAYLYENTDDLRYAWRDDAGWHNETVDTEGYVGKCSSLVLDAVGNPRISYFDDTFENKDDLKYAWRDGAGWHNKTVDTAGLVGWDTSLALDAAGDPRISYFDDTNDDLKYAWCDGAGWHSETVDSVGAVGMWTSLALDGAGTPWISYFDDMHDDLRFARGAPATPSVATVPGADSPPSNTDGDRTFEDVNGNGRADFADVVLYFNQMSWIAGNEPIPAFDYNGNSRIDFADVVWLFNALADLPVPPIVAGFSADQASGPAPLSVRLCSTSTGPFDDLAWTVSSSHETIATLNGTAPAYTFEAAGAYTVALTAKNTSTNRSDTAAQSVTVTDPSGANLPYPAAHVLPCRVEAEDYDVSVGRPAYADTTTINEGGAYRLDAVDIEVLSRNYNIGWIRRGEFLNYSVDAPATGTFALTMNVANAEPKTEPVRVYLDGVQAGEVRIGLSSNWWTFREFAAAAPLTIPKGRHVLTISFEVVERMNFDWMNLAAIGPTPTVTAVPEAPYPGAHVLPAQVEAEHFDAGGEGVAYHDLEPSNLGSNRALRPGEGVDIETEGGVTNVCFVRAGEFLNYSVDATAAENVTLSLRAANPDATAKAVGVYLDGVPTGQVLIAPTGGWTDYQECSATAPLAVPKGRSVITLALEGAERVNLDYLRLSRTAQTATPAPTATTPAPTVTVTPNVTPTVTATVTPTEAVPPGEEYTLMVTGLDLANEWATIRNTGDASVDLEGCILSDEGSTNLYTFPSFALGGGETVKVHSGVGTSTGTDLYRGLASGVWNDDQDTATLKRPDGTVISAVAGVREP